MLRGSCDIWVASIPEFAPCSAALNAVLSTEELTAVDRMRESASTARLSRGLLRLVLAGYLGLPAAEIEIDRSCRNCGRSHGKPRLRKRPGASSSASSVEAGAETFDFSVSHGGTLLVLAVAQAPVGVDVEPLGTVEPVEENAKNRGDEDVDADLVDFALTDDERNRLLRVPRSQRKRFFLHHWTGREAALKALGCGLEVAPQAVTLPPYPGRGMASLTLPGQDPVDLWVTDVEVGPGHVCSLATGAELRGIRLAQVPAGFVNAAQADRASTVSWSSVSTPSP